MANLSLIQVNNWLLFSNTIFLPTFPAGSYLAVIGNLILLTVGWRIVLAIGDRPLRWGLAKFVRLAPIIAVMIFVIYLRNAFFLDLLTVDLLLHLLGKNGFIAVALALPLFGIVIAVRWYRSLVVAMEFFFLIVSPLVVVTLGQDARRLMTAPTEISFRGGAPVAARQESAPRVLLLILDGMGQLDTFPQRAQGLSLPEFDRFRNTAIYATNAVSPGWETLTSIPGMIAGRIIAKSTQASDDVMVTFSGSEQAVPWGRQPNLFSAVREGEKNVAVAGYFIPYCALFRAYLVECSSEPNIGLSAVRGLSVPRRMLRQLIAVLPWGIRQQHIRNYQTVLERAESLSVNPDLHLVFAHMPVPHGPGIYDRERGEFVVFSFRNLDHWYSDNMALADQALGQIRRRMESADMWDSTTVLVTSDHPRHYGEVLDQREERRVPFLLKLAGQKHPITYDCSFNTVAIHDLVLALLRKEVSDPDGAVRWLGQKSESRGVSSPGGCETTPKY